MNKSCSICKKSIRRLKQLESEFYCYECLDKNACPKCNQIIYDGCFIVIKSYVIVLNGKLNTNAAEI